MSTIGTIYVLANLSIPILVKVGKTIRTVEERIKELSGATGVPNQFIVLYEQMFIDVDKAESEIHTLLEMNGYRHATNREFFNASPSDVIKIINSIEGKIENKPFVKSNQDMESDALLSGLEDDEFGNLTNLEDGVSLENYVWYGLWTEAECKYYGLEDYLQDYNDAKDLYIKAGKLGCPFVYQRLGDMFLNGEGVTVEDSNKALEFFKKGTQQRDYYCYLKMAILFLKDNNYNNVTKCLNKFIYEYTNNKNALIETKNNFIYSLKWVYYDFNISYPAYRPQKEFLDFILDNRNELIEGIDSYGDTNNFWNFRHFISSL